MKKLNKPSPLLRAFAIAVAPYTSVDIGRVVVQLANPGLRVVRSFGGLQDVPSLHDLQLGGAFIGHPRVTQRTGRTYE